VVISHGRLRASGPLDQVLGAAEGQVTRVRARETGRLAGLLRERGVAVDEDGSGALLARGTEPEKVGEVAAEHRIVLIELGVAARSLEEVFLELTQDEA
jgi:ABC-2 type transport system ATP-binding protein